MKKMGVFGMSVVLTVLMVATVQADFITVSPPTAAYDGAVQIGGTNVWDTQMIDGGNEEHWLQCLTAGVVKFQIPILPLNAKVDKATLVLSSDGRPDGTSLGSKAGDPNYSAGVYSQLQHYTYDNNVTLCSNDAADSGVEKVSDIVLASGSWNTISLDVTNAVIADITAGYTYTGFRVLATDYTGRILTTGDLTAFNGYLTAFFSSPSVEIEYSLVPEPATMMMLCLGGLGLFRRKNFGFSLREASH